MLPCIFPYIYSIRVDTLFTYNLKDAFYQDTLRLLMSIFIFIVAYIVNILEQTSRVNDFSPAC